MSTYKVVRVTKTGRIFDAKTFDNRLIGGMTHEQAEDRTARMNRARTRSLYNNGTVFVAHVED